MKPWYAKDQGEPLPAAALSIDLRPETERYSPFREQAGSLFTPTVGGEK